MRRSSTRRAFLTGAGTLLSAATCGCSTRGSVESEVEPVTQLGGASKVRIEVDSDREYSGQGRPDAAPEESPTETSTPFDEWATRHAVDHAAGHVGELLTDRLESTSGVVVGFGTVELADLDRTPDRSPAEADFHRAVPVGVDVGYRYRYSRAGELLSEPDVSFETLVNATPWSIAVRMLFPEREYKAVLPVVCARRVFREL